MGTALMSVVLTNQFNRSESITAAANVAALRHTSAARGLSMDQSVTPGRSMAPGFSADVLHDLSHAYTVVFVIAVVLVACTLIPASFLPKTPVSPIGVDIE